MWNYDVLVYHIMCIVSIVFPCRARYSINHTSLRDVHVVYFTKLICQKTVQHGVS